MDPHEAYFQSLNREEKLLLRLKKSLYEDSWEELVADLAARKAGRPSVLKLESRIDEDLARIEKLRAYEEAAGVDLGAYLPEPKLS